MKKFFNASLILLLSLTIWGCKDNSTGSGDINEAPQQRQFVWDAMNYWYFWQTDVPELADDMVYFDNQQAYHDFLMGFNSTEDLFYALLFSDENFENMGEDDFSFFIDDYEAFRQSQQGVSRDFGFEYGLVFKDRENSTEIFGYVQYVLDGTPADEAGLERGDIFTAVNGTSLTINNYRSALASDTYELTLADYNGGELPANGETVIVNTTQVEENPIFISKVIDTGSSKVGYMLYNSFQLNSHENLNNAFGDFLSEGIDELVLDLRYNGGGTVVTANILASLISGQDETSTFIQYTFNDKRSGNNRQLSFLEEVPLYDENRELTTRISMKTLNLDRVYILTGFGTASASEAVINGLLPYIDVTIIGRQTVGKDDVSFTLYDTPTAPYLSIEDANPSHNQAIQPIVAKSVNADGQSNNDGFLPQGDLFINELSYLDDLPPLGEKSDPLLAKALELISGEPVAKATTPIPFAGEMFKDSRDLDRYNNKGMYIVPGEIEASNTIGKPSVK